MFTLSVARCDDLNSIDWFYGKWFPAINYPHTNWIPLCNWMELSAYPESNCTCGDRKVPAVFHVYGSPLGVTPVIDVNKYDEVEAALNLKC